MVVTGAAFGVLFAVIAASIIFAFRVHRRGARGSLVAGSALALFAGLITTGLALGHLIGVLTVELRRSPANYDFRVYGLLLLGVTLAAWGARLAASAPGVARGQRASWKRALGAASLLLVVSGPLVPIDGFAVGLAFFVSIALLALLAAWARIAK